VDQGTLTHWVNLVVNAEVFTLNRHGFLPLSCGLRVESSVGAARPRLG
jgi:hypothetical protein